jgi:hypothetical protein
VRAVDLAELRVGPAGALGAFVLAVTDLRRLRRQRRLRCRCVEVELDHLPVALVLVVEVVEDVEEPVLKSELPEIRRVGRDVRIDGRLPLFVEPLLPGDVGAVRAQRVAREVEVVVHPARREVADGRGDLDDVGPIPRAAEDDLVVR